MVKWPRFKQIVSRCRDWVDERIGLSDLVRTNVTEYKVPHNLSWWYSLGSVLFAFLATQFITGILLLMYYVPSTDKAFDSILHLMNDVPFGWFMRRVHAVGANLFIVALFLHMLSTLYMGSYKKPREMQWFSGVFLFALGLAACLSGYLLPWSQLSYWATTVATNIAGGIPFIGEEIIRWVRGADRVGQLTLGRFYALHVSVLPLFFLLFVGAHILFMRRTGISAPPGTDKEKVPKIPFYPHYVLEDLRLIYIFLGLMFIFVFFAPQLIFAKDSLEMADPFYTPAHIKPEWYFLAAYQILKIVPNKYLGIGVQLLVGLFLFLLPLIDRGPERRASKRPVFFTLYILGILAFIGLTVWGARS